MYIFKKKQKININSEIILSKKMTNLTPLQVTAVGVLIKAEVDKVLGRIKSLEDQVKALKKTIEKQGTEIVELKEKLEAQDTKIDDEITKLSSTAVPENVWNTIASNPAVKSGIINMVTTENNKILRKEKNLVIMEKKVASGGTKKIKSGIEAVLVKEEIVKIFAAIGLENTVVDPDDIRLIRKDADSPILMVFKDVKAKMEVLKLAKKLKGSTFDGVYINNDLTKEEAATEKILRAEMLELNSKLSKGSEHMKYEEKRINEKNYKWWWGVRSGQLRKIYAEI